MNTALIGQNSSGKPETFASLFSYCSRIKQPVLILDYKNHFKDHADVTFSVDHVNINLEPIGYQDMIMLNAGYEKRSHLLYTKSLDVLEEYHKETPYANQPFEKVLPLLKKDMLLKTTIERLSNAWGKVEPGYGEEFFDKIPIRKAKKHTSPSQMVENILDHWERGERVRLTRKKNVKAEHLCAITFLLLLRLVERTERPFMLLTHELNSFWNKGNTKLFLDTIDKSNIHCVLSFAKTSDVPASFVPYISQLRLFAVSDKKELTALSRWGDGLEFSPSLKSYKGWYECVRQLEKERGTWKRTNLPFTHCQEASTKH